MGTTTLQKPLLTEKKTYARPILTTWDKETARRKLAAAAQTGNVKAHKMLQYIDKEIGDKQ